MAERTGPHETPSGGLPVAPPRPMPNAMVVAAKRSEMVDGGRAAFGPGDAVIEVARPGRHPASGKHARLIPGDDVSLLCRGWAPSRCPGVERPVGPPDGIAPGLVSLVLSNLAGNVGHNRPIPGQFPRGVGQANQRGEVDLDVHGP